MKSTAPGRWATLKQRFRGDAQLTAASLAAPVISLGANLVATRYVAPDDMGVIQTLMLIPIYFAFLNLGVFNALNRDVAFYLGRSDEATVQRLVDSSWSVAKALSLLGAVTSALLALWFWFRGFPPLYLWAVLCVAAWLVSDPLFTHLESVYRSSRRFSGLAAALLWQNLATLVSAVLPVFAGAVGAALARGIQGVSRVAFRLGRVPYPARSRGSLADVRGMIRTGFPILLAGALTTYLMVADRTVVAFLLHKKDVGDLNLAALVVMAVQLAPATVSGLLYPRVSGAFGRGNNPSALRRYVWIGLGLGCVSVLPVALLGLLLLGPFTHAFLPKYVDGIRAAQIAAVGSLPLASSALTAVLASLQRMRLYVTVIATSLVLAWLAGVFAIRAGFGIDGAVTARCGAHLLLAAFVVGYAFVLTRPGPGRPSPATAPTP